MRHPHAPPPRWLWRRHYTPQSVPRFFPAGYDIMCRDIVLRHPAAAALGEHGSLWQADLAVALECFGPRAARTI